MPKKRDVKDKEKQSKVRKKVPVPDDEEDDNDDEDITTEQGLAKFSFLKSLPNLFPTDHKNNELKWPWLHTECEKHSKDLTVRYQAKGRHEFYGTTDSIVHRLLYLWENPETPRQRRLVLTLLGQLKRNTASWATRCPVTKSERTQYRCLYCKMNISSTYHPDRHPDCMWVQNIRQRYSFPKV